ncbi:MAG: hypothetical protein IIB37_02300 [Gemmatimonadetes bacterium]|nr:hypothetical protein [Gemmatimonadota bacterium]
MSHIHVPSEIPIQYLPRSKKWDRVFLGMFVVGLAGFLYARSVDPDRAWQSYVSNWLFFTNIAMGAVLLTVVTWITKAKWNWSVRRVSLAFVAFLPISFVLFLPMLGLGEAYFPWVAEMAQDPILDPILAKKAPYLNMTFLLLRNVIGVLLLFGVSLYFAYLALRPDMGLTGGHADADRGREWWRELLSRGWLGQEVEEVVSYRRMTRLAPAFVIIYALMMSILSYDWVMSLEPHWYSTMMGPWFFMGAFWSGIAATAVAVTFLKRGDNLLDKAMGRQQMHDLGKLTFAFSVFWAYLFFAQYLVIWYGKLPWEQIWIIHRAEEPWGKWSAALIVMCFVVPFAGLLGRKPKMSPLILRSIAIVLLSGLWLEKHLMVAPSIRSPDTPTLGGTELLVALMFLGIFLFAVRWFLSTFPLIQVWQPMVDPETFEAEMAASGMPYE